MRSFEHMNPAAVSVCLLAAASTAMLCSEPLLLGISLIGGAGFFISRNGKKYIGFHIIILVSSTILAVLNPLWNQHGETLLFAVNDRAYTLEALCYGATAGVRLAAVLYWFRSFTDLMTGEKLFYLFGIFSNKLALVFTMALRDLTLFRTQIRKIQASQKALGLYREGHLIDDIRSGIRIFSILLTWALENGIITASSMAARGYGIGKRSKYVKFIWNPSDFILVALSVGLASCVWAAIANDVLTMQFYPTIVLSDRCFVYNIALLEYAVLAALPLVCEGKEALTWRILRSKI